MRQYVVKLHFHQISTKTLEIWENPSLNFSHTPPPSETSWSSIWWFPWSERSPWTFFIIFQVLPVDILKRNKHFWSSKWLISCWRTLQNHRFHASGRFQSLRYLHIPIETTPIKSTQLLPLWGRLAKVQDCVFNKVDHGSAEKIENTRHGTHYRQFLSLNSILDACTWCVDQTTASIWLHCIDIIEFSLPFAEIKDFQIVCMWYIQRIYHTYIVDLDTLDRNVHSWIFGIQEIDHRISPTNPASKGESRIALMHHGIAHQHSTTGCAGHDMIHHWWGCKNVES